MVHGFSQSIADNSLFTKGSGSDLVVLLVYVDDIVIEGPNKTLVQQTQQVLTKHFKLKVLGDLKYFLGLEIANSEHGIHLCQREYTLQLLSDTGFLAAKPLSVPMEPNVYFNEVDGDPLADPSMYRCLIGRLMYLTISRLDITYVVKKLSQFKAKPKTPHL